MSGLALLFSGLAIACLVLTVALMVAGSRRKRAERRASKAEGRLQVEQLTHRRIMFGSEFRGDRESSAGCPVCGAPVDLGRVAFILIEPPSRLTGNVTVHAASRASAHVMRFDPCGCVWDSTATSSASPHGLDLVCVVDGDSGRTRFGLATRDETSVGAPTVITEVRGAGGECAL
jgi:hypothetical protein